MASTNDIYNIEFDVEVHPPEAGPITGAFRQMGSAADTATSQFDAARQATAALGDAVIKAGTSASSGDASWRLLMGSINPYIGEVDRLQGKLTKLNRLHDQGRGTQEGFAQATRSLTGQIAEASQSAEHFNNASGRLNITTGQSTFVMRTMGREAVGAISALASGAPVVSVLAEQISRMTYEMTLSRHGFSLMRENAAAMIAAMGGGWAAGAIAGIVALGAAGVALAVHFENAERQLNSLGNALRATHTDWAALAQDVTEAGKAVSRSMDIARTDATAAVQAIASAPGWSGTTQELEHLGQVAVNMSLVLGGSVADNAKLLAKAMSEPGAVAKELADRHLPTMGAALEHSIQLMDEGGRTAQGYAADLNAIEQAVDGASDNITEIQRAMRELNQAFDDLTGSSATFGEALGNAFRSAAATAIQMVAETIKAIHDLAASAKNLIPSQLGGGSMPMVDEYGRVISPGTMPKSPLAQGQSAVVPRGNLGEMTVTATMPLVEPPIPPPGGADWFSYNQGLRKAQGMAGPWGDIERINEQLGRMRDLQKLATNPEDVKTFTNAISNLEKQLEAAKKATQGHAAAQSNLSAEFARGTDKINIQATQIEEVTAAMEQGGAVTAKITAQRHAEADMAEKDTAKAKLSEQQIADLISARAQAYEKVAAAQAKSQAEQQIISNKNQIEVLDLQTASIGKNADETERNVEAMKVRQDLLAKGIPLEGDLAKSVMETSDALVQRRQILREEQASFSELSGFVDRTMDDIGQAIANSFLSGQGAAVNFMNVVKSVFASLVQEMIKLALINPLKMMLTGEFQPTLGSVANAWGSMGGGGGMGMVGGGAAVALGGLTGSQLWDAGTADFQAPSGQASGGGGSPFGANNLLTIAGIAQQARGGGLFSNLWRGISPNFGNAGIFSPGGIGGNWGGVTSFMQQGLFGTSATEQMGLAGSQLISEGGGLANPLGAINATNPTGILGGASIGGLATGVLGGFGAGSFAGGLIQRAMGKTGPGPMIGAGGGALAGAAIGSIIPGIGTVIGGLIGGLLGGGGGGMIGPKPPSPYQASFLGFDPTTGQVISNPALAGNQLMPSNFQEIENQKNAFNQQMNALGVRITGSQGINQTAGPYGLGFFGSAKNAAGLAGGSLADVMGNIRFGAGASIPTQTAEVLNRALDRSFASFDELGQEITKVRTFVETTVPALREFGKVTGTLNDAIKGIHTQFDPAIATAHELGYAEQDLIDTRDRAIQQATSEAWKQLAGQQSDIVLRGIQATAALSGDPRQVADAQLQTIDLDAQRQREKLANDFKAVLGEAYAQNQGFIDTSVQLEHTLGVERLVVQKSANDAIAAADKQAAEQREQQMEQARATGSQMVASLAEYARGLQYSQASPLSARDQLQAAQREFNAVGGAAAAGDANSLSQLQSRADTLLSAGRAVFGSGQGYADIFRSVTETLAKVAEVTPDTLTASIYAVEVRTQTATLVQALADLRTEMVGLRAQVASGSAMPSRLLAA